MKGSIHLIKLLLDFLELGLGIAVAISVVTISIWVITIVLAFSAKAIWLNVIFVKWLSWLFVSNLSVLGNVAKDWACGVSVFVSTYDSCLTSTGIESSVGLSDNPR